MGTVTLDIALLLEIAGGIVVFGGASVYVTKAVKKVLKPMTDLKEEVQRHSEYLDNDNKRLKKMEDTIEDMRKAQRLLLRSQLTVLEHLETNNATGKMAKSRQDINDFLIEN